MTVEQFQKLHELVGPNLITYNPSGTGRKPLPTELQLAAVLNFLAHGPSIRVAAWITRIGLSTMYKLVPKVCTAIVDSLKEEYIRFPNADDWVTISNNFFHHWQMPNCLGSIDSKHIRITAPPHSGSFFHNYKKFKSILLMGTSDAFHRFTWLNVGEYGHQNDAGTFNESDFGRGLEYNLFDLPEPQYLPGTQVKLPYFFIGDNGFGLKRYLLVPFMRLRRMTFIESIFNYRLSRARRIIECAFGILVQKWRILKFPINFKLQTTEQIVLSLVCLHNFMITDELSLAPEARRYVLEEPLEEEDDEPCNQMDEDGIRIRNILAEYFVSQEGAIDIQWDRV